MHPQAFFDDLPHALAVRLSLECSCFECLLPWPWKLHVEARGPKEGWTCPSRPRATHGPRSRNRCSSKQLNSVANPTPQAPRSARAYTSTKQVNQSSDSWTGGSSPTTSLGVTGKRVASVGINQRRRLPNADTESLTKMKDSLRPLRCTVRAGRAWRKP